MLFFAIGAELVLYKLATVYEFNVKARFGQSLPLVKILNRCHLEQLKADDHSAD